MVFCRDILQACPCFSLSLFLNLLWNYCTPLAIASEYICIHFENHNIAYFLRENATGPESLNEALDRHINAGTKSRGEQNMSSTVQRSLYHGVLTALTLVSLFWNEH